MHMETIFTWRRIDTIRRTIMLIHNQADILLILLALAGATLLFSVLKCRASGSVGGQEEEEIERAKQEWLADFDRRLDDETSKELTPEQITETLRHLQATMPVGDRTLDWRQRREELARLISVADVDEECAIDVLFPDYEDVKYSIPLYMEYRSSLVSYVEHFKRKQVEACASKIGNEMVDAVASLSEAEKHEADVFASYAPQLLMGSYLAFYKDTFDNTKEKLVEAICQFLKAAAASHSSAGNEAAESFNSLFETRMKFCTRVEETTRNALDNYLEIRGFDSQFVSFLEPEPKKWIKVALACRRLKENESITRSLVHDEFERAQAIEEFGQKRLASDK